MKLVSLINLYRLPLSLNIKIIKGFLKRKFGLSCSEEELTSRFLLGLLIDIKGICKNIGHDLYCIRIPPLLTLIARRRSSDLLVLDQIFRQKNYQAAVDFLLHNNIRRDAVVTIIDAGSNVGYSILFFKKEFPNAKIVGIEPDSGSFALLKRNIEKNNINDVVLLKGGLWSKEADLEIGTDFRDGKEWSRYVKEADHYTGLKGYPIPYILSAQNWSNLDLLKMDIEGGERFIFGDAAVARTILAKVKFIAIEIHDEFKIRDKIHRVLTSNNYDFFEKGELTIGRNKDYI